MSNVPTYHRLRNNRSSAT